MLSIQEVVKAIFLDFEIYTLSVALYFGLYFKLGMVCCALSSRCLARITFTIII